LRIGRVLELSSWWSIIKFDPAFVPLRVAFKEYVDDNPDATDDEILEYLSDPDNVYDEYDMISDEDKRAGTLKDIDRFNEMYGRERYAGPAVFNDYHKNVFIPIYQEIINDHYSKHTYAIGGKKIRELLEQNPNVDKTTLDEDLRILSQYMRENDKYKDLRRREVVRTPKGNPDFRATKRKDVERRKKLREEE